MSAADPAGGPAAGGPAAGATRHWLQAALLWSPVALFYTAHYLRAAWSDDVATGFLCYDAPYYLANARSYLDADAISLCYRNPYDPAASTPAVYFQPLTALLALLWRLLPVDPGLLFVGVGAVCGIVGFRLVIALFEQLFGLDTLAKRLALVALAWGGGLQWLFGLGYALVTRGAIRDFLFVYDPSDGWWFLNLGRNFVLPTEAWLHALTLAALLAALRGRHLTLCGLLLALGLSHPFTGLQIELVMLTWLVLERLLARDRTPPVWVIATALAITAGHLGYYLGYLPRFESHAALSEQWRLDWLLQIENMIPAYILVAGLAYPQLLILRRGRVTLDQPGQRLLLIWFAVSLLLAKHDLFIEPIQPRHFTRGNIWTPLFLLGVPALLWLLQRALALTRRRWQVAACGALLALLLSDNAVWLALNVRYPTGLYLQPAQREVLDWLAANGPAGAVLVGNQGDLNYLAATYTPLQPWCGHRFNTPAHDLRCAEQAAFLSSGREQPGWCERPLYVLLGADDWPRRVPALSTSRFRMVFESRSYEVLIGDCR